MENRIQYLNSIQRIHGSITLRWEADEIKNDKLYEMHLDPKDHYLSHGRLINTLKLYHENIYKYLIKNFPALIENQFFVALNKQNIPRRFSDKKATHFSGFFNRYAQLFMKLEEVKDVDKVTLIPHFLRGTAGDWYHFIIGLSVEQTAKVLGDAPETVKTKYLRNDQHIVKPILDIASKMLKQKSIEKEVTATPEYITHIEGELLRANNRAELAEKHICELLEQLTVTQQQNSILQQRQAQNHVELIEKLNKLSGLDS